MNVVSKSRLRRGRENVLRARQTHFKCSEAARLLGVSHSWVYKRCRVNKIIKIEKDVFRGGNTNDYILISREDLVDFLDSEIDQ